MRVVLGLVCAAALALPQAVMAQDGVRGRTSVTVTGGLENLNDVGQRWTMAVSAALTFRF